MNITYSTRPRFEDAADLLRGVARPGLPFRFGRAVGLPRSLWAFTIFYLSIRPSAA